MRDIKKQKNVTIGYSLIRWYFNFSFFFLSFQFIVLSFELFLLLFCSICMALCVRVYGLALLLFDSNFV